MDSQAKKIFQNKYFYSGAAIVVIFVVVFILSMGRIYDERDISYGVTFSPEQATDLGLDWQQVFVSVLDELGVKNIRLSAYWDVIEKNEGAYDWDELDWQVDKATERGANMIIAVGGRLPRWPECHFPDWTKSVDTAARQTKQLEYIKATISRYKNNPNITAWQVENEPFLPKFGNCPPLDIDFLDKEIALVHELDSRPVVVTDSGELSIWIPAARRADIFGTTMYRDTYSTRLNTYIHYPITPAFFRIKKNITSLFARPSKWMVIELEAEPWAPVPFQNLSQEDRDRTMSEQKFTDMLEFARQTGFQEYYLWGVEWWYWEKTKQNRPFFWDEAKKIFSKNYAYNK